MENSTAAADTRRGQLSEPIAAQQSHGKMLQSLAVISAFNLLSQLYHLLVVFS